MTTTAPVPSVVDSGARPVDGDHLAALESEAVHIIREVVAEFDRPVLLFSGGKDSAVLLHLARRAFHRHRCRSAFCTSTPGTTSPR